MIFIGFFSDYYKNKTEIPRKYKGNTTISLIYIAKQILETK